MDVVALCNLFSWDGKEWRRRMWWMGVLTAAGGTWNTRVVVRGRRARKIWIDSEQQKTYLPTPANQQRQRSSKEQLADNWNRDQMEH